MARKKNALAQHKDHECGCSITTNPNNCIYQTFPDGWDFTPDVGNGKNRGEIFTPRFIVDKMITDVGLIPKECVYNNTYDLDEEELRHAIYSTVIEPAIGTGNFTSTILYHKLQCAKKLATTPEGIDNKKYDEYVTAAVSSVYAYDIDPGNIEVSMRRLTNGCDTDLHSPETEKWWIEKIAEVLQSPDMEALTEHVQASLKAAHTHWQKFLHGEGVLTTAYADAAGKNIPEDLLETLIERVRTNVKIFNGLSKEDTGVLPGWHGVWWTFWNEDGQPLVSMNNQIVESKIEELEKTMADFESEHKTTVEGLFSSVEEWDTKKSEREWNKMCKKLDGLRGELLEAP